MSITVRAAWHGMAGGASSPRVALAGLLLFALLAIASGMDRATAGNPALARFVPPVFAAEAHRARAASALGVGRHREALAAARQAVLADPIDPRSTALLGAAHLAARNPAQADRAFRVAARFGWRDPLTQLYLMEAGMRAGQPNLAALRLDAVLRQDPRFPLRDMLIDRFMTREAGRTALAARLALRPDWSAAFMGKGSALPLPALQARARLVAGLPGKAWGCDGVAPMVGQLVQAGDAATAKMLWLAQCPLASRGIADPHFRTTQDPSPAVPFEWNLAANGDLAALPHPEGGLVTRVGGAVAQPVAWQMLTLPPGRYRLQWYMSKTDGTPAGTAGLSLSCLRTDRRMLASRAGPAGRLEAEVTITGQCAAQYLTLWQAPGPDDLRFDGAVILPRR